jgi:hypothetical protein
MENNDKLLSEILIIEEKEKLGNLDDNIYLKKIKLLCDLAGKDTEKVWGEYEIVQQITKQPVLMNKAMSIPLSKSEVSLLLEDLYSKYEKELKANNTPKVNLTFSTNIRGHAKTISKEIVLPKLGDWRFGYSNVYSAELIFHEFAHLLDYGRLKYSKYKNDIHKHDFVRTLDNILLKYQKFIEDKYIPSRQRKQILDNSAMLVNFYANQEEIEQKDKEQEEETILKKQQETNEIYKEIGLNENSYPLYILLKDDSDIKLKFINYAINNLESSIPISLSLKEDFKSLKLSLNEDKPNLNKATMNLLMRSFDNSKINSFMLELPLMQQLKASSVLRKFIEEVRDLSNGKIASLGVDENYKIRTYSDAEKLRKRGLED